MSDIDTLTDLVADLRAIIARQTIELADATERASTAERERIVGWLREADASWRKHARNVTDGDEEIRADGIADGNRYAADAIEADAKKD